MLLLTTPDYLPKMGGLTTHTLNVEKVLKELGIQYDLYHWKNYKEIFDFPKSKIRKYDFILNIHSGFQMHMPPSSAKVINFICGAEILFYSPHFLKHMIKQILKSRSLKKIERAHQNIFISNFTFQMLINKGFRPDYSRDLIFHMCVDTNNHAYLPKNWNDTTLKLICVARDVPHKNIQGAINFCETIQELSGKSIELITLTDKIFESNKIKIRAYVNPDNKIRDELLAEAHLNLLFSLDHSKRGFFEGFGQIVQEAGCFATPSVVLQTGGLPESVHHGETGWVLQNLERETIEMWWKEMSSLVYSRIAKECYDHTLLSHGLDSWKKLFNLTLK